MSIEFEISNKYLRSNRKNIIGVSIFSLIFAVITLVTVLSVMNGFHKEIRNSILNAISHSYIAEKNKDLSNWQQVITKINQNKQVIGSSPYIEKYALVVSDIDARGVQVRGIEPNLEKSTSIFLQKNGFKESDLSKSNIVIGEGLARQLNLFIGDKITLLTPKINSNIIGIQPRFKKFTISHIFEAGTREYDSNLVLIQLEQAQKLYLMQDKVSGIRIRVADLFKAKEITNNILASLPGNYYGIDWTSQKSNFIKALQLEKQMIAVILFLIIAVAIFNIISTTTMVVNEKRTDIAILKTIGMTPKRIIKIFFYQALTIGAIGISIGVILGIILAINIGSIVNFIELIIGFKFFPDDVFYINRFPSEIQLYDIITIIIGTILLVIIASIYAAKNAGKVKIAELLNNE
jgi:lipoprotein-releasing system permease protein